VIPRVVTVDSGASGTAVASGPWRPPWQAIRAVTSSVSHESLRGLGYQRRIAGYGLGRSIHWREAIELFPAISDPYSGMTTIDSVIGQIIKDDAPEADNRIYPQSSAGANAAGGPNPDAIHDRDGGVSITHGRIAEVMVARTEKSSLGYTAMISDRDRFEIDDGDFLTDPGEIADYQFPRKMNADPRLQIDLFADLCSEQP